MKKFITALFALALMSVPAFAFEAAVPDFDVYIDGNKIEYKETKYPLLTYKDITYFPMTYHYVHMLGLTSSWTDGAFYLSYCPIANGQVHDVDKNGQPAEEEWAPAVDSLEAQIAQYPIYINGKLLDNSKEEYPVLSARDITYFPLTWRFATQEFGHLTNWDGSLSIAGNDKKGSYIGPGSSFDYIEGDKAWFSVGKSGVTFGENGQVTWSGSTDTAESYVFDAVTETVTPYGGERMYNNYGTAVGEKDGLRIEGNYAMYGDAVLEDMTDYLAADAAGENLGVSFYGNLYDLGGGYSYLSTSAVHASKFPAPHRYRRSRDYIVHDGAASPIMVFPPESSTGDAQYKTSELINGVPWLCLQVEPDAVPGWTNSDPWYYLYTTNPEGNLVQIGDADHGSLELIGQIDGKPVIKATWLSEFADVSAVNDGYFVIDPEIGMTKIYPYVYSDASAVLNNHLYLLVWRNRTIIDACCGEEIRF